MLELLEGDGAGDGTAEVEVREAFGAGGVGEVGGGGGEEEGLEAVEGDTIGAVAGDVGEESLLGANGEGGEVVLVILDVEIPVLGEMEEGEVL